MTKRKPQRKETRQPVPGTERMWPWIGGFVALLAFIAISGLSVVQGAHDMRDLYRQLGEVQREHDTLLADHSRLLLERGARSSLQNIEEVAQRDLDMEFPTEGQVIE